MDNGIVRSNLAKMMSVNEDGMLGLLMDESFGGNADFYEAHGVSYPCGAANFHYKSNGEILRFTNEPRMDYKLLEGMFRVADGHLIAANARKEKEIAFDKKIVGTFLDKRTSAEARTNIDESARLFNEMYDKA